MCCNRSSNLRLLIFILLGFFLVFKLSKSLIKILVCLARGLLFPLIFGKVSNQQISSLNHCHILERVLLIQFAEISVNFHLLVCQTIFIWFQLFRQVSEVSSIGFIYEGASRRCRVLSLFKGLLDLFVLVDAKNCNLKDSIFHNFATKL